MAEEIRKKNIEKAQEQIKELREKIVKFAQDYRSELSKSTFRDNFMRMCLQMGVDPLQSRKGFWAELLGIGEFYQHLAVKMIKACARLKRGYGGLVPLEEVCKSIQRVSDASVEITEKDLEAALRALKNVCPGYEMVSMSGRKFIKTSNFAMDQDLVKVLELADGRMGYFTNQDDRHERDVSSLGWVPERVSTAINKLMGDGLVWVDQPKGCYPRYYVCAMFDAFNGRESDRKRPV